MVSNSNPDGENLRVMMVMPSFPSVESGAEQQDRAEGIRQLVRLGHEVVVIAKINEWADKDLIQKVAVEMGVRVITVAYKHRGWLGRLKNPLYLDGAAYEFAEPEIQNIFERELESFKPDVAWFEYTFLWPLYSAARERSVPIITRSINLEPQHFLEEDGIGIFNCIKYMAKLLGERRAARWSDAVLAITPNEAKKYKKLGARVFVLPLRSLPRYLSLPRQVIRSGQPLHVFFMGSSYNVSHNRAALRMVLQDIAPLLERAAPGEFILHILGAKVPNELQNLCDGTWIIHEGYVPNLDTFLQNMDIALIPSLMGAGMQQKVFEPLARGIPTITSPRAIAGYPFKAGEHYLAGRTTHEFVSALLHARDLKVRTSIASVASKLSIELFSQENLDGIVFDAIETTCQKQ